MLIVARIIFEERLIWLKLNMLLKKLVLDLNKLNSPISRKDMCIRPK